jgi:tellurite resistance protein
MTGVTDVFRVLFFFAGADGKVEDTELDVIRDFLAANKDPLFDFAAEVETLKGLDPESALALMVKSIQALANQPEGNRRAVLEYILLLITSDGRIEDAEARLFTLTCALWDFDPEEFIKGYL